MNRQLYNIITLIPRAWHRRGFGVQSPWAYELVRDVFFERMHYYAYHDLSLSSERERQLWRINNHFSPHNVMHVTDATADASRRIEAFVATADATKVLVIDDINSTHTHLWQHLLRDSRATVTFDLGYRGVATFDPKRYKQNYIL